MIFDIHNQPKVIESEQLDDDVNKSQLLPSARLILGSV